MRAAGRYKAVILHTVSQSGYASERLWRHLGSTFHSLKSLVRIHPHAIWEAVMYEVVSFGKCNSVETACVHTGGPVGGRWQVIWWPAGCSAGVLGLGSSFLAQTEPNVYPAIMCTPTSAGPCPATVQSRPVPGQGGCMGLGQGCCRS